MAEESQVTMNVEETRKGSKEVITKGPKEVTTKNPEKVETGKRLAEYNHKKREAQAQKSEVNHYYGTGALLAVGVISGLGYYLYQAKKGEVNAIPHPEQPRPQTNKFEML